MINLTQATNRTSSIQSLLDSKEKHLCSLQVIKPNVVQDVFVSMIRSKLSESSSVDILIGNDYYPDIIMSQRIEVQPGL